MSESRSATTASGREAGPRGRAQPVGHPRRGHLGPARDRLRLRVERLRQGAAERGGLRLVQAQGRPAVQRGDRDDLRRQLHRRPDPGQAGPAHGRHGRRRHLQRGGHPRVLREQRRHVLAARPRLRHHRRLRARHGLHRADRHAAEVVPRQAGTHHRARRGGLRLRRGHHGPGRAGPDRQHAEHPDQGLPLARDRLPRGPARRQLPVPQPAGGLPRGVGAEGGSRTHRRRAGRGHGRRRLHAVRGPAHAAVVPAHRHPHA